MAGCSAVPGMEANMVETRGTPNLRGIIFDMDGVLCDSEPFIAEAACRMFAEMHSKHVAPEDFIPFVGTGEDRYLGGVAEKYGAQLQLERDKARTYAIYLEIIKGRLTAFPGVHEFIARAGSHGLALAIATSADRIKLDGNLIEIGVAQSSFKACITGSDVKNKKPHPDIFLAAAAALQLAPEQCLVIEDAPNGVQAAKAAGSPCLGLATNFSASELQAAGADWIVPNLLSLPEALQLALGF